MGHAEASTTCFLQIHVAPMSQSTQTACNFTVSTGISRVAGWIHIQSVHESGVPDEAYLAPSGTDGFGGKWLRRTARAPSQRLSSSATAASTVTYGDGSSDRLDQQIGASRVGGSGKRLWRRRRRCAKVEAAPCSSSGTRGGGVRGGADCG